MQPERGSSSAFPQQLTAADHTMLRSLARQRAGILIEPGREYFLEMRVAALACDEGFASPAEVMEALRTEESWGVLHRRVAESLAIAETSWFRDAHPFDVLRRDWLPGLIQRRPAGGEVRVWCAACASGQEPFSFAMMWREHFAAQASVRLQLLATDFSHTMLRRSRDARYSQIEVNRGLPAPLLVKHFRKAGTEWQLQEEIRSMVEFRELNLIGPWPHGQPFDVVFMRNVLLYLEPAARRAILDRVRQCLAPDGLLVLGAGESAWGAEQSFESLALGKAMFHRPRSGNA